MEKRVFEKEDKFMKTKTFLKYAGLAAGTLVGCAMIAGSTIIVGQNTRLEKERNELIKKNEALMQLLEKEKKCAVCRALEDYEEDVDESENDISEHDEVES